MNYCTECGQRLQLRIPDHDDRERHVCGACGHIHYVNPRIIVCAIPATLPAGFMENGESTGEGAERETMEEAGARIALGEPFSILDVPQVEQVHMFFMASLVDPDFDPGPESLEAKLFTEAEIPWDQLAFRTVTQTLRWFFEDRRAGHYRLHTDTIRYQPKPRSE